MTERQRKVDYVPRNAAQFVAWLGHLLEYITAHKAAWGHIPQPVIDNMWDLTQSHHKQQ